MRQISKPHRLPALAGEDVTAPCYQPFWWYIANALRTVAGKELLDPVHLCAL
jgi:hypothetical protein